MSKVRLALLNLRIKSETVDKYFKLRRISMSRIMNGDANSKRLFALFALLLGLSLTTAVTAWATTPTDPSEPGSVLVFPLFERGTITQDGVLTPVTQIEISITRCPRGSTVDACSTDFAEDVNLHADWVCPAPPKQFEICAEADFTLESTPKGTILINPENLGTQCPALPATQPPGCIQFVPPPPCPQGYLIVWVVDDSEAPIKFDRLIGDAVIREHPVAPELGPTAFAYNAIPIQAAATLADGAVIPGGSSALNFNGAAYKQVTGKVLGSVHFNDASPAHLVRTDFVLLTLDVLSNAFNNPTQVNFLDFNENQVQHSGSTLFACWERTSILAIDGGASTGFAVKGLWESTSARDLPFFIGGNVGPVTLLGLVITSEGTTTAGIDRQYAYPFLNNSVGVSTSFVP
jgi:hypothetical protein